MFRQLALAAAATMLLTAGAFATDQHAYYMDDPLYQVGAPDIDYAPRTSVEGGEADASITPPAAVANAFAKLRAEGEGIRSEGWDPQPNSPGHMGTMPGDRTTEERVRSGRARSLLNDSSQPSGDDPTSVTINGHETGLPTHPPQD